jgi:hypothetical protein
MEHTDRQTSILGLDSEALPEAENSDDNNHQDQHHAHNRCACNQGQLLPPALTLIQLGLTMMFLTEGAISSL